MAPAIRTAVLAAVAVCVVLFAFVWPNVSANVQLIAVGHFSNQPAVADV